MAPFGLRPKGTLLARMVPLAAGLQQLGDYVTIVAPPYTNPEDSGKVEVVDGVTVRNIGLGSIRGPLAAPGLAWRLLRAAWNERPHLIHLFKPKGYGGLAAMALLMGQRLGWPLPPLFVDTDDWEGWGGMNEARSYSYLEKRLFQFQESWLTRRARGVTVASRTLQTQIWGFGVAPDHVAYVPNGVSPSPLGQASGPRQRWNIPPAAPVVLLYTRFLEFDLEKLVYVFEEIHRRAPATYFLVVGQGRADEAQRLKLAAASRGFLEALRVAGWVSPPEIPHYLAAGDVAIYPMEDSLVNRAKCPAKLTELLMAERAVVADKVGQTGEYINHGVSGLLCEPEDWPAMANHVCELLNDEKRRRSMGGEARHFVQSRFAWKDQTAKLYAFYRRHIAI